jgi:hypothetical protein
VGLACREITASTSHQLSSNVQAVLDVLHAVGKLPSGMLAKQMAEQATGNAKLNVVGHENS